MILIKYTGNTQAPYTSSSTPKRKMQIGQQELAKKVKYQTEEISDTFASPAPDIEEQLMEVDQRLKIMRALHHVKEPAREVLYLRILGDLSYKEIGEILNQSETWARVTFYRGKQELLKGDFYE